MIPYALFLHEHFQYTGTYKEHYTYQQNCPTYRP